MAQQKIPSRTPAQPLKFVISVTAVAATLGGWALLASRHSPAGAAQTAEAVPNAVSAAPAWLLEPPVIPTVQPLVISDGQRPAPGTAGSAQVPGALYQRGTPAVVRRPAPIVVTRSSR